MSSQQSLSFETLKTQNAESLEKFLKEVSASSRSYYVKNMTMDFLRIALKSSPYEPANHVYYYQWIENADLPISIKNYGKYVHDQIDAKHTLEEKQLVKQKEENESEIANDLINRNLDKVLKFLEIAYRKVTKVDDYGDENPKALHIEMVRLLRKLVDTETILNREEEYFERKKDRLDEFYCPVSYKISEELSKRFDSYYEHQKKNSDPFNSKTISKMKGVEFEQYLIEQLRKCGARDVKGTPVSGDQGADIFFSFDGVTVVVQAKRHNGTVGVKAIQEVHTAKDYFRCDCAWVITNSEFTSAARTMANELSVHLIDGADLARFTYKFQEFFQSVKIA